MILKKIKEENSANGKIVDFITYLADKVLFKNLFTIIFQIISPKFKSTKK